LRSEPDVSVVVFSQPELVVCLGVDPDVGPALLILFRLQAEWPLGPARSGDFHDQVLQLVGTHAAPEPHRAKLLAV
jgi:hypothetical protein